jgi:hypothetical protein
MLFSINIPADLPALQTRASSVAKLNDIKLKIK